MFNFFSKPRPRQDLFFETDIHCHVLPGIDDGSPDVATSVELIERMQSWGIKRIIASPHITFQTFENDESTISAAQAALQQALNERGNNIELSHSAENRIDDMLLKNIENDTVITLPDKRVLIENSFMLEPWNLDTLLFDLQVKGFRPILVHPERYPYYYRHKERYEQLHNAGAAFQINLLSLAGYYGKAERQIADYLIEKGLVDYVGTDLHRRAHADSIEEYLSSKDYLKHREALEGKIGNDLI